MYVLTCLILVVECLADSGTGYGLLERYLLDIKEGSNVHLHTSTILVDTYNLIFPLGAE